MSDLSTHIPYHTTMGLSKHGVCTPKCLFKWEHHDKRSNCGLPYFQTNHTFSGVPFLKDDSKCWPSAWPSAKRDLNWPCWQSTGKPHHGRGLSWAKESTVPHWIPLNCWVSQYVIHQKKCADSCQQPGSHKPGRESHRASGSWQLECHSEDRTSCDRRGIIAIATPQRMKTIVFFGGCIRIS